MNRDGGSDQETMTAEVAETLSKTPKEETIASYQDLVRVFHAHPDWLQQFRQMVLTYDLIELPRRFDEFVRRDFTALKTTVDQQNERLQAIESNGAVLKEDVAVLKEDVAILKQDVAQLKQDVAFLQARVERMAIELAELKGNDFERTLREKAPGRFARVLRRCRVLHHEALAERLEEALDRGQIDEAAFEDALAIDLVVAGLLKEDRRPVILAIEASLTVDRRDVERAACRADIIAVAMGSEAIGVAFCKETITEGARELAVERGVLLL